MQPGHHRVPQTGEQQHAHDEKQCPTESLDAALADLRQGGATVHGVVADVTAPGEVERFVKESAAALGGADLLVANVGGTAGGSLLDSTAADWVQTFEFTLGKR